MLKDALYFMLAYDYENYNENYEDIVRVHILKYDLRSNCLSLIDAPSAARVIGNSVLMAMEDGCLGFAHIKRLQLCILSSQIGSHGVATWTRSRVINLKNIPPIKDSKKYITLLGSVEGTDIIFVYMEAGIYKINLKHNGGRRYGRENISMYLFRTRVSTILEVHNYISFLLYMS